MVVSPKGEWLCSVPGPTGKRSYRRTVKVIVSPGSEVAGTGLVGVRNGRVGGQAISPEPCPLDVIRSGWEAGGLLHY